MDYSLTAVIIDDERHAIELLETAIKKVSDKVKVLNTFTSWSEALIHLSHHSYDIVFLDISMKGNNGFDLLKSIPNFRSEVIFITAHADYAIDAFKVNAAGYILKPVEKLELANTLNTIVNRTHGTTHISASTQTFNRKIGVPTGNFIMYVPVSDILYLEAMNSYTKVVTFHDSTVCSYNIGRFKKLLDHDHFFAVHRSYLINLDHVKKYDKKGTVEMSNKIELPVAKDIRPQFLTIFSRIS